MFLENLKELSLIEDNIKIFPKEICKLINLEILTLLSNELREIPEEIGELINLKELNLADNIPTKDLGEMEKIKFLVVDEQLSIEKIIKKDFDSEGAFFIHYDLPEIFYHEKFFSKF